MESNLSQIIIKSIVRKKLNEMKDSPERSLRNLVDMALNFSGGRFQRGFLNTVQAMLKNENSPYYNLLRDIVFHVDHERLTAFGMNVGYNSCTAGAKKIRAIEKKESFNIPWTVFLHIDSLFFSEYEDRYDELITQGEEMGIYTWQVFCEDNPEELFPLISKHPDSAFILFIPSENITDSFLDAAEELSHLMISVKYGEHAAEACQMMRGREMLYSVHYTYTEADRDDILSGDMFYGMQQLHPAFTILLPNDGCTEELKKEVYQYIVDARTDQLFQTLLWEAEADSSYMDEVISGDACTAGFDAKGQLFAIREYGAQEVFNILKCDIKELFRQAFPKKAYGMG